MTDVAEFIRRFTVVNRWELMNMCGELMRTWYENPNTYLRTTANLCELGRELRANLRELPADLRELPANLCELPANLRDLPRRRELA